MSSKGTTIALLVVIVLVLLWATGKLQKIAGAIFGQ
jgi:Sec-independent protein translocase protein TatA